MNTRRHQRSLANRAQAQLPLSWPSSPPGEIAPKKGKHMKHTRIHPALLAMNAAMLLMAMVTPIAHAASLSLTGEQEVPAVITSGNGSGELTVTRDGTISGSINTHGVTGTMAHIHQGAKGINGPVVITLVKGNGGMWTVPPTSRLTADLLASYRAGGLYVNVHSEAHPGGEIRTQLMPDLH
jgi:hypothetical protein